MRMAHLEQEVQMRVVRGEPAAEGPRGVWNSYYLDVAAAEGHKILTDEQYEHVVQQVRELAAETDPTHSQLSDVRSLGEFHELRDKGGLLGRINIRVFFWLDRKHRALVVLGVFKKENEDQTPRNIVLRIQNRLRVARQFMEGEATRG